jgi:hypothetical protein
MYEFGFGPLIIGMISSQIIMPLLGVVGTVLQTFLLKTSMFTQSFEVNAISNHVMEHGIASCLSSALLIGKMPGSGFHVVQRWPLIIGHCELDPTKRNGWVLWSFLPRHVDELYNKLTAGTVIEYDFRSGDYTWDSVSFVPYPNKKPTIDQQNVINYIMKSYQEHGRASVLLMGKPGTGKSMISSLVTMQLARSRTAHGFGLGSSTLSSIHPLETNPLVVPIDEIDLVFERASKANDREGYHGKVIGMREINDSLDKMNVTRGVVLIATTNKTREELQRLYGPQIRMGRWGRMFEMNNVIDVAQQEAAAAAEHPVPARAEPPAARRSRAACARQGGAACGDLRLCDCRAAEQLVPARAEPPAAICEAQPSCLCPPGRSRLRRGAAELLVCDSATHQKSFARRSQRGAAGGSLWRSRRQLVCRSAD